MQASQVIPFRFEARDVRTLLAGDQPWFFAVDVCSALALSDTNKALLGLDSDEKCEHEQYSGSGRKPILINESGLYSLILRSRKAEAKRFKKWVTAEVLPAIRKHGRYEDAESRMATLVGQTIGTDGFHMLGALIKGKVSSLPVSVQRRATAKIWSQAHAAFGVRSAADIPAEQLDAARNFIAAYNVLEGEYIEGRKVGGLYLDDYETHHLYLLMSRFAIMSEHRGSMLAAARALDSKPLWTIFGQLDEGRSSFSKLDQRRAELYAIYSKDGFRGGYAMSA